MTIVLNRIDDRMIHGQVVVGWGQPLGIAFIVLVNDEVAAADWEQELYRMAVPPQMTVYFHTANEVGEHLSAYRADRRPGILLTADIETMQRLVERGHIDAVTIGGIHHRPGRVQRMRYVFLTPDEERELQAIEARGVTVVAQDVPTARPVPLSELLKGTAQ